ncbi:MAG: SpoIIE family protein phosphatase [Negativibacillus massiliensis]|uniref:SpoIIE family protein phosphatase n=1 Tax=Negativibacillus massiliensis TaxID=1871035 RepID=UPI00399956D3
MKNRTDFVRVGWKEQLWQAVCNQMEAAKAVLWVLFGFVVGLGNMMMEISPFGAALCAAVPQSHLLPTAFGAAAGSLLLSNLSQLGGTHTFTIKYAAAVVIITAVRRVFQPSKEEGGRLSLLMPYKPAAAPLLAFAGMLLPSLAVLLASPFDLYSVVMSFSEAILAGACAYFLTRSLHAFSLGQGMFTLKRADFISVVLTSSMLIVSLSNITFGGISFGRLLASIAVLLCALVGGERWGAVAGIVCGTAVSVALFPKMQLLGIYALAGLAAGVFSGLGRWICAGGYAVTFGALSVITASPPVMPLLYEAFITAVSVALLPENVMTALKTRVFRQPMENSGRGVRQLMLERLDDASQALREIAATTQAVSQKLDRARSGSLEQVYDEAVDNICLKCGLKTRCWQQEYGDTVNVFNHLTPVLRQNGSVCAEDFIYPLSARCTKREQLSRQINAGYQELTAKEGMSRKVARVRSVVTDQFEGLAQLLGGLSEELCGISSYEEQMVVQVKDYLEESRYRFKRVDCYRDEEDRIFLQMDFEPFRAARLDLERMTQEISRVCDCEFDLPQKTQMNIKLKSGEEETVIRLCFQEKAQFEAEFAASQHICQGYRMCGDAYQSFTDRRSVAHIILSDGMGSGTAAAVDSNMTVSLLQKLIDAGVGYQAALKIVNSALLVKSGEESLSTIDITAVNLYTGQAWFYKAGAAPTFLRRSKRCGLVESTSLPAGILTAVDFEKSSVRLGDGDMVVMVSDGATACGTDWISSVVEHFPLDGNLQALCDDIASTARLRRNDNHDDDITVCACRVKKVD